MAVAVVTYLGVARYCHQLDRLASKYIYYGVLARAIPSLKLGRSKLPKLAQQPTTTIMTPLIHDH